MAPTAVSTRTTSSFNMQENTPIGKLILPNGQKMSVVPHGAGKVVGYTAAAIFGSTCVIALIALVSLVAGGTGYAVGIPVYLVGSSQANATMILVGKIFFWYGVGCSALTGVGLLACTPFAIMGAIKKNRSS